MQIEVVTIPITELSSMIENATAKGYIKGRQEAESPEDEMLSVSEACVIANKSRSAIISWCKVHGIGHSTTGTWIVSKNKLIKLLNNKR